MKNNKTVKPKTEKKSGKRASVVFLCVILAVILAASGSVYFVFDFYQRESSGGGRTENTVTFNVPEGTSFSQIAKKLENEGFIGSELCFKVYLKLNSPRSSLKAGKFNLSPNMSYGEIIEVITGKPIENVYNITAIEGLTQKEILKTVSLQSGHSEESLLAALDSLKEEYWFLKDLPEREQYYEGYLYPDTYEVFVGETPAGIMKKLLDNFEKKYNASGIAELLENNRFTLDEAVTLGSIVQCEAANVSEMKDIAGVFVNRLKINMKLESCVTVYYVRGDKTRPLSTADTKIQSPYNTYYCEGLPKGPISNMRIEALVAALSPADNPYYYFIGAGGRTIFAKTYAEHQKNIDKYL